MNPISDYIARSAAVAALVLGTVLAGVCVPAASDAPLNTTDTTVTASSADASDVGWQ
ncbi:hypothetical protein [Streptomyces sp. NPDC029041]|uniref:hypothetical protein n=1 Tax=Streptomyces sp. NPDC029041 TaxID=3155727 RepID=UPI003404AF92